MESIVSHLRLLAWYLAFVCCVDEIDARAAESGVFAPIFAPANPSLPTAWQGGDVRGEVTSIPQEMKSHAEQVTKDLLQRYPRDLLVHCLKRVILVGDISFYEQNIGGTYWNYDLIIAAGYILHKHDDTILRKTLHHELSSLVKLHYDDYFPDRAWVSLNPAGFEYQENSFPKDDKGTLVDIALSKTGFLCAYSKHSLEDDFNMIVENMFEPSDAFYDALEHCALIRAKCRLAADFYILINPECRIMIPTRVQALLK